MVFSIRATAITPVDLSRQGIGVGDHADRRSVDHDRLVAPGEPRRLFLITGIPA